MANLANCNHVELAFWPSRRTEEQVREALQITSPARKKSKTSSKTKDGFSATHTAGFELPRAWTFPAPLVLPSDTLEDDPDYPVQTVQDWIDEDARNEVTQERRTIYLVPPPSISEEVEFARDWTLPPTAWAGPRRKHAKIPIPTPSFDDVIEYLQAFYRGLKVQAMKTPSIEFMQWDSPARKGKARESYANDCRHIALSTGDEAIRVRCRPPPDRVYLKQLNLNDLLDAALSILPDDAYALLMLVDHDLYEDEEDDFCCGRAYGGSRVAVVSTARYRPELDKVRRNDSLGHRWHAWPNSHCKQYSSRHFSSMAPMYPPGGGWAKSATEFHPGSAMASAVVASSALPLAKSPAELSTVWLGRICKTASHELGHCLGIDHCTYYACVMQATSKILEDYRQPPYLCPIDLKKVLTATEAGEEDRYKALLTFCDRRQDNRMFAGYGAWLRTRLEALGGPALAFRMASTASSYDILAI